MDNFEQRIQNIEDRNKRVEADKSWERSLARRVILAISSYLVIAIFFIFIKIEKPWINAIVPALAFMIQQLSMPFFKKKWLEMKK